MRMSGFNSSGSGLWSVTGYCEPGHQPSGSTKYKEFLDQLGNYSITPLSRTMVIRNANYTDRHGPSGKIVENST